MALLDGIARRLGYTKAQVSDAPTWLRADAESAQYTIPDRALPEAQLELYQRLSWVQIAVAAVAEQAATTKFNVMAMDGEDTDAIENHPFEMLLRKPNPLHSRFEFLVSTVSCLALTGNCYWWLNRSSEKNTPDELWVLPPHKVKPIPDGRMFLRGYMYEPDAGVNVPLEAHEVVHFRKWHPLNTFVGLSPIESLATDVEGEMAMQKWNTNLFAKDNAKVPGALAFADPINDSDWSRMKDEIKREHGGTKRSLMMLRNVGQGGVQWVQMAMSQNDMQFLQARTFTKEEIFAIYAPGLSSILAVNATEANSVAGKSTFIGMGVYPKLVQIAEKITNDILPSYGDNLVGEFEDIRPSDRLLALQEQQAAERVHTVDEIRQKFYNEQPIGDERGALLVVETNRMSPQIEQPAPEPMLQQPGNNAQANQNSQPDKPPNDAQQQAQQDKQTVAKDNQSGKSALKTAQVKVYTSVMVSFFMPTDIAVQLAELQRLLPVSAEIVPASELHLTLDIIGKVDEYDEARLSHLKDTINLFLSNRQPLFGRLNGLGRFHNADVSGTDVIYASFDSVDLPEFRQSLVEALRLAGFESSSDYGYQPHVTLGYVTKDTTTPMLALPKDEMFFDQLYLSIGGNTLSFIFGKFHELLPNPLGFRPTTDAAKRAEVKAFKAWLKKRPQADIHMFKAEYLTHDELHEIADDIRGVATEQPFFTLPETFTRESVKALLLLNPDDDEAEQKIRMELERRSARNIDKAFTEMVNTLYPAGYDGFGGAFIDPNIEASRIQRAFREEQALRDAVSRALIDSADLGVSIGIAQLESVGIGFDYLLAHTAARDWAIAYTDTLLEQMAITSGRLVGSTVARWFENGEPLEQLIQDLEPVFGRKRAERIAATEVTRAAAQGTVAAGIESGVIDHQPSIRPPENTHVNCRCWLSIAFDENNKGHWIFRSSRDERVCPICAPLEGRRV